MTPETQEIAAKIVVALSICFTIYFYYKEFKQDSNG
tara:strand:+ start:73 stop:180 length:108 start_codon:yes stop_codon:yes gene_type:complete